VPRTPGNRPTNPSQLVPETSSSVNPRLLARLEAWKRYQTNGGQMSMAQWIAATQRQYGGISGGYRSGYSAWERSTFGVHGNSLLATGPHDVYVLRQAGTDRLLYFGETGRGYLTRFAEHQRDFAQRGVRITVDRLDTVEGKAAARLLETRYIDTYHRIFGRRPPFNGNNH
jgi:hypothetical protein